MWHEYINAISIDDVLPVLAEKREKARVVAGATDLILELERGVRKEIETVIDITRIPDLDRIILDENEVIHLGPLVTHNQCASSKLLRERAYPLARASWEVGSPQIRNRGTVAGNMITASPANDTISPLMALNASVTLRSVRGERTVPLPQFYLGVRRTVMEPDEMVVDISFAAMKPTQKGTFTKFALRRAQAISVVNETIILDLKGSQVQTASITLGSVAPTIIHAREAEEFLAGKVLSEDVFQKAAELAMNAARPINDIRGSAAYRRNMVRVITKRGLRSIANGNERDGFVENPVLLWGKDKNQAGKLSSRIDHTQGTPIKTTINGKEYVFTSGQEKTLLHLLRDEAQLVGTKEGCAEGECGACTIFLDGIAVMGCMVPAPRAHGAKIVTVEGLASEDKLHPVQQAFIDKGAVQCGYCTPGFLMSAAKLLEERPHPDQDAIRQAITGNLCRCTGYYKIIEAIELAAEKSV